MKFRQAIAVSAILATTQACTVPLKEFRYAGGYPGYQMDRHLFVASGAKKLQLLRLTMILAAASRVGVATIRDGQEAEAFISYLRNATNEVNYLAAHLYGQPAAGEGANATPTYYSCRNLTATGENQLIPPPPENAEAADLTCSTYTSMFESDLPQLEYKVMRVLIAALPREQAARFIGSLRSGNAITAAWNFIRLAAASLDAMHRGAAVQRTTQEILAILVNLSDGCNVDPTGPMTVRRSVDCLNRSTTDLFDTTAATIGTVNWPEDPNIDMTPFQAVFEIIRTSCTLLPVDSSTGADTGAPTGTDQGNPVEERQAACRTFRFKPTLRLPPAAPAAADAAEPAPTTPETPVGT